MRRLWFHFGSIRPFLAFRVPYLAMWIPPTFEKQCELAIVINQFTIVFS